MESKSNTPRLWAVKVDHRSFESLWIIASNAKQAYAKAIHFCKKTDGVRRAVVKSIISHGTIDVF